MPLKFNDKPSKANKSSRKIIYCHFGILVVNYIVELSYLVENELGFVC